MNEYLKKKLQIVLGIIVLVVCVALVIVGQRNTGAWSGLATQILGLGGILVLLFLYNKQYSK